MALATNGAVIDVPMMQQHDEELVQRQLREELLSALNHDLRSPLGAVGIFCEILLLNPASLDDNQRQSLSMIQEANAKAQRILDDAAELTAIYKGNATLRRTAADLAARFDGILERLRETFDQKAIHCDVAGSIMQPVMFDAEKIDQVLLRLMEEAIGFCGKGGSIEVKLSESVGKAMIAIETTGNGHVVDIHKRPPRGSVKGRLGVRKHNESHYSLAACQRVAQLMGGNLELQTGPHFIARLSLANSSG